MRKIDWRRLALLSGLLVLIILLLRGLLFACANKRENDMHGVIVLDGAHTMPHEITLYLKEEERTVSIELEAYIAGVVAAEMPCSFHEQALCAQAVAARTYTLRRIENGGCISDADICSSSKCCQAYASEEVCKKKWGESYACNMEKIISCVQQTAGEALYYDGKLIEALYHAASGGFTEDSENVFASVQPYLRSVESKSEIGSSYITSEAVFTRKAFTRLLNSAFPKAKLKSDSLEKQVEVTERFSTGRVKTVRIGKTSATGREMRAALELRSAWFYIEFSKEDVLINARGYGHGVGMSQTGANGMAQGGADYHEILAHYYSGASIIKS